MSTSFHLEQRGTKVVARIRLSDGIDRPDFFDCELTPSQARSHAAEMVTLADLADAKLSTLRADELTAKKQKLAALQSEIGALKVDIARRDAELQVRS